MTKERIIAKKIIEALELKPELKAGTREYFPRILMEIKVENILIQELAK